jgi:hypothetical protein
MLIELGDKIISTQIFEKKFVCDLNQCKGACCVEGDAGAPLSWEEVKTIQQEIEKIKPFMRQEGIEVIENSDVYYLDEEDEPVTSLVNENECVFVQFENGIAKCAIEQAHKEGVTDFKKPISCHLYPIRLKKFNDYTAINYEEWAICKPACSCGEQLNVPVFKFLKEPLVRAFGSEFYNELEQVSKEI